MCFELDINEENVLAHRRAHPWEVRLGAYALTHLCLSSKDNAFLINCAHYVHPCFEMLLICDGLSHQTS